MHRFHCSDRRFVAVVGANDDAVRMLPVVHSFTFAEKFWVGDVTEARPCEVVIDNSLTGSRGHGAFHHHNGVGPAPGLDPRQRRFNLAHVCASVRRLGRPDRDEGNLTHILVKTAATLESQATRANHRWDEFGQTRFVERDCPRSQLSHTLGVDVDSGDAVPGGGEICRCHRAHETDTDHGDFHAVVDLTSFRIVAPVLTCSADKRHPE